MNSSKHHDDLGLRMTAGEIPAVWHLGRREARGYECYSTRCGAIVGKPSFAGEDFLLCRVEGELMRVSLEVKPLDDLPCALPVGELCLNCCPTLAEVLA